MFRHLEMCRTITLEDLRMVKNGLVACFPPEYNIYDRYVRFYHETIAKRVCDIAGAESLTKAEIVQLLSWVRSYT